MHVETHAGKAKIHLQVGLGQAPPLHPLPHHLIMAVFLGPLVRDVPNDVHLLEKKLKKPKQRLMLKKLNKRLIKPTKQLKKQSTVKML